MQGAPGAAGSAASSNPTRNALCPCGSGKKFKRCCGAAAPQPRTAITDRAANRTQIQRHLQRATELRQAGRFADTIAPLSQAAELDPSNPDIHHDLGRTLLRCGRIPQAIAALRQAVRLRADFSHAHWRLGIAYESANDPANAIAAYRQAVSIRPLLPEAALALGRLLEAEGHRHDAISWYRQAATAARRTAIGRVAEARALIAEQRDHDAERVLRRALALEPGLVDAQELLAHLLSNAGQFDAALACYQAVLERAPERVGLWYDLVRCRRILPSDRDLLHRLRSAAPPGDGAGNSRILLHLAAGKALEDLGAYQEAMREYDLADEARRGLRRFDAAAHVARVEALIANFRPMAHRPQAQAVNEHPMPLVIVGMPRSGTTLVEHILSSHPQVAGGGEMHFWGRRGAMFESAEEARFSDGFLRHAQSDYLDWLRQTAPGAQCVTDKMPFNYLWAGLIHLSCPDARIIHCCRDPLDTAVSIHSTFFSPRLPFPTGGADLVLYYRAYVRLMRHWQEFLPADRYVEIHYKSLVRDPERESRKLIAFAGLEWRPECLRPEANPRLVKTASKWQVRQPVNNASVRRSSRFAPWLGPLAELGATHTSAQG